MKLPKLYIATGLCLSSSLLDTPYFQLSVKLEVCVLCRARVKEERDLEALSQQEVSPPW